MRRIHSIVLLIASLLLLASAPVFAQSDDDSAASRRETKDARFGGRKAAERSAKHKSEKPEPVFPLATRAEPNLRVADRDQRTIQKILDLSQGTDEEQAKALEQGNSYLANAKVKGYPRAFVSRVLADVALNKDDSVGAIAYYQAAIDEDALPNDQHYQTMLAMAQAQLNADQMEPGLATLDRVLSETKTDKPDYLIIKANALYQMQRYPEALALTKRLVESTPEPKESWLRLLLANYAENDQPAEAARVMRDLVARHPDDKTLLLNLAGLYQQAEDINAAVAVLNDMRTRGLLDADRDYRSLYAMYANMDNHEADVIAVINEGLEKKILLPSAEAYTILAQANYFSEHIPEAIAAYRKAADIATDGEPSLNLARVYSGESNWKESRAAAQAALAKGIKRPGDAWVLIGRAEFGLDNRAGMAAAMKKAATYPETKASAEEWLRKSKIK